jgi:hypothetical protein
VTMTPPLVAPLGTVAGIFSKNETEHV